MRKVRKEKQKEEAEERVKKKKKHNIFILDQNQVSWLKERNQKKNYWYIF